MDDNNRVDSAKALAKKSLDFVPRQASLIDNLLSYIRELKDRSKAVLTGEIPEDVDGLKALVAELTAEREGLSECLEDLEISLGQLSTKCDEGELALAELKS